MRNEPSTIVYRCDFVRQGEKQKTKKERHAIYERNRRKATDKALEAFVHLWFPCDGKRRVPDDVLEFPTVELVVIERVADGYLRVVEALPGVLGLLLVYLLPELFSFRELGEQRPVAACRVVDFALWHFFSPLSIFP